MYRNTCAIFLLALSLLLTALLLGCGGNATSGSVNPPPDDDPDDPSPIDIVLKVSTETGVPKDVQFVAFRKGTTGSWTRLSPSETGVYTATVSSLQDKYGVILVEDNSHVSCYQARAEETTLICHLLENTNGADGSITIDLTLDDAPTGDDETTAVYWGPYAATGNPLKIVDVPAATFDLCGVIYPLNDYGFPMEDTLTASHLALTRDVVANNTSSAQTVDFGNTVALGTFPVTVTGNINWGRVDLLTAGGTTALVGMDPDHDGAFEYGALPAGNQLADDQYRLWLELADHSYYTAYFHTAEAKTAAVNNFAAFPAPTIEGIDHRSLRWNSYPNARLYRFSAWEFGGPTWTINITPGYLTGTTAYSYTLPAITSLSGWQSAWDIETITGITSGFVTTSNSSLDQLMEVVDGGFVDGMTISNKSMNQSPPAHTASRNPRSPLHAVFPR